MELNELTKIMKQNGVVGAGGAGFPTYAKLDKRADTLILNCAECEPLLKLHRQVLEKYAHEILSTLDILAKAVEAERVLIAVKGSYRKAVEAVQANLSAFPNMELSLLPEIYPAGDEVVLIYETTKRVVPPGSIPITVGVTVFNVETILNVHNAIQNAHPVTEKFITIAGEVKNPITLKVPIGITASELVDMAGGVTVDDPVFISGGPMTGRIMNLYEPITKTSNAILVMPRDAIIVTKRTTKTSVDMKRAMSACCQCRMCTDLCPRNLLGHPIEPHAFMHAATSGVTQNIDPLINTMFCCSCGVCEMYACFQGLSPRTLIGEYKAGLRKNGIPVPKGVVAEPVRSAREYRRLPMQRLIARLGLAKYNVPAPLQEETVKTDHVKIMLSQHIGAPASAVVKVGDKVQVGQVIGQVGDDKLGVCIHASMSGTVTEVTDKAVTIQA